MTIATTATPPRHPQMMLVGMINSSASIRLAASSPESRYRYSRKIGQLPASPREVLVNRPRSHECLHARAQSIAGRRHVNGRVVTREKHRRQRFHNRIPARNPLPAKPASPIQLDPPQNRDVVVPKQRPIALRTVRPRMVQRLPARQPPNDHVQKAPHARAQQEQENQDQEIGHRNLRPPSRR